MNRSSLVLWMLLTVCRVRGFGITAASASSRLRQSLRLAATGRINGEGRKAEGQTGWNHNPPGESSSFWSDESERSKLSEASNNSGSESSNGQKPKTGWLHYTEKEVEAPPQQEVEEEKSGGVSAARQMLNLAMKQKERNHRILHPATFHACGAGGQIAVTEHMLSVPVFRPTKSPRIDIYFTVVEKVDSKGRKTLEALTSLSPNQRADAYVKAADLKTADGLALYLQGGPGFGAPTPAVGLGFGKDSSWGAKALETYDKIVLMDQRGTGKSTPITKQTLEIRFPDLFLLDDGKSKSIEDYESTQPEEVSRVRAAIDETTEYLAQFRADNIVQDAEEVRDALLIPSDAASPRPWGCSLGQSFGGFCLMTYLATVENPPQVCLFTGGIAPMLTPVYELYTTLWHRMKERNLRYYDMYPGDVAVAKSIVKRLLADPPTLPSGGTLTARRFLQLGMALGSSPSSFASFHSLLSSAFTADTGDSSPAFSRAFLKHIDSAQSFDDAPIYFWLHESIYGDGPERSTTNWAAHRAYEDLAQAAPEFDYRATSATDDDEKPTLFFGEMVFPWMSSDYEELSGVGLTAVANALASKSDWGPLFDASRMRQALDGRSRAAAAVYHEDVYVDFDACLKVAARGGPLEKCKLWVTNEYQHSGLRDDGAKIFEKLHGMATGTIRTPS